MKKLALVALLILLIIQGKPAFAETGTLKGKIIVLDPGHGGFDPGAVKGSIREKEINLQTALKLKKALEEKGATVILTRDGDFNMAIPGLHRREAHRYDLSKRLEVANKSKADLLISIHVNSTNMAGCMGAEVFFNPKLEKNKFLAESIQHQLLSIPDMKKRTAKAGNCYILSNSGIPTVLIEIGYLSNPTERNRLTDSNYQDLLVEKIAWGIQNFSF